jgi:hypothetical protein
MITGAFVLHLCGADLDLGVAGLETAGVCRDRFGPYGPGRKRVAGGNRRGGAHESAPRDRGGLGQPDDVGCHGGFNAHRLIPS